jgi:pilus assembly protein Flp/PilA
MAMCQVRARLIARLRGFLGNVRGATAIEYALMASGISLAIISTIWSLGSSVKTNLYDKLGALF